MGVSRIGSARLSVETENTSGALEFSNRLSRALRPSRSGRAERLDGFLSVKAKRHALVR